MLQCGARRAMKATSAILKRIQKQKDRSPPGCDIPKRRSGRRKQPDGKRPVAVVRRLCSNALMHRSNYAAVKFAALVGVSILGGCDRPVSDPQQLKAIHAEAQKLMRTHTAQHAGSGRDVPREQWPTVISSLHPENVTVHTSGVGIPVKAGFDGGYGYEVPRNKAGLSMPAACYSEPSPGVFWHSPC